MPELWGLGQIEFLHEDSSHFNAMCSAQQNKLSV